MINTFLTRPILDTFESYQFTYDVGIDNKISSAMMTSKAIDNDYVKVITLNEDGSFDRSYNIQDKIGLMNQLSFVSDSMNSGFPIKVENMETYSEEIFLLSQEVERLNNKPCNVHMFVGFAGKGSFGWHSDDSDVFCYMVSGIKQMETESGIHQLNAGDWLYMPNGIRHCATNITDTVMLSFGYYNFWNVEERYA